MGDEDKQFDATPQKLERARKEGQVVKSKDVSTALSLLVMFSFINMLAPIIWKLIVGLFKTLYEQIPNQHIENIGMTYILTVTLIPTVVIIGAILFVAAFRHITIFNLKYYYIALHRSFKRYSLSGSPTLFQYYSCIVYNNSCTFVVGNN